MLDSAKGAERQLRAAEEALRAERAPELIPVRKANVAFSRYHAAFVAWRTDANQIADESISELESIVALLSPAHGPGAVFACNWLRH